MQSEPDIVEVTVMEVLERISQLDVFMLVQSRFLTNFLVYGRNTVINNIQDYHLYRRQVNSLHHFKYCIQWPQEKSSHGKNGRKIYT